MSTADAARSPGFAALLGRDADLVVVHAFLERASAQGDALLVLGEPGVGKSVLLDVAAEVAAAGGAVVLRCGGVEFEADVSFSALNQALLPLHAEFAELDAVQRKALDVALGLAEGPMPDRLVVSNGTLCPAEPRVGSSPTRCDR